jgi:hypothetical protein
VRPALRCHVVPADGILMHGREDGSRVTGQG